MSLLTTEAVVLHAFDYLESSRIVRLVTREAGLVSVIARGVRSARRRAHVGLDLFAGGSAHILVRPTRDLQQLAGFEPLAPRAALGAHLERFAAAAVLAELTLRSATDEAHGAVYGTLAAALDALAEAPGEAAREVGLAGAWRLVEAFGFAPALDACCRCHAAIAAGEVASFHAVAGGCACVRCAPFLPRGRTLPWDARRILLGWRAGDAVTGLAPEHRRAHQRLLREFLEAHVADGRPLRAFDAWERPPRPAGGAA